MKSARKVRSEDSNGSLPKVGSVWGHFWPLTQLRDSIALVEVSVI